MKKITTLIVCLCITMAMGAKTQYTQQDSIKVMTLLNKAKAMKGNNCNWVIYFARQLKGIPYVAHTLENNDTEQLVINLRQLDCTTYVENVVALTLCVNEGKLSFEAFCNNIKRLRYEGGQEPRYNRRLHYFTSWIEDNTKMDLCHEVQAPNPPFTGVQKVNVDYMTKHVDKYRMLDINRKDVAEIRKNEMAISGKTYRYIPKLQIKNSRLLRNTIKDGDIIAIITNKKGLDTQHIGFAVWHKDGLHLLNASSIHKKVVEEPLTLAQYLARHKTMTGIRIVRLK